MMNPTRPESDTVLHSWCVPQTWQAPTIVGGQGAWLFSENGQRILDMSSLAECSNLGHQHPAIIAAIKAQAEQLCFVTNSWGATPRARLAELLLEKARMPDGRVFFTLGGADANEHAVKFARQASGKPQGLMITRDRSYHGASYAAMALSGDSRTQFQVDAAAYGVVHVPPPYAYRCPFGSESDNDCGQRAVQHLAQTIDCVGADHVAGVMMEVNAGTNGIVPPKNYWPQLRALTRARDVLLIADEVMSGFGRCGHWFAWQAYGDDNAPDIMTVAKGLTGAHLPLGAVIVNKSVAKKLSTQMLFTGLTYCGHPLCCAAGVAAIESYEHEQLITRSRTLGQRWFAQLQTFKERCAYVGDVRGGDGLFAVIELVSDREHKTPLAPWPETHPALKQLVNTALTQGVSFATRGNLIILAPPLVISENDLSDATQLLQRLLSEWRL